MAKDAVIIEQRASLTSTREQLDEIARLFHGCFTPVWCRAIRPTSGGTPPASDREGLNKQPANNVQIAAAHDAPKRIDRLRGPRGSPFGCVGSCIVATAHILCAHTGGVLAVAVHARRSVWRVAPCSRVCRRRPFRRSPWPRASNWGDLLTHPRKRVTRRDDHERNAPRKRRDSSRPLDAVVGGSISHNLRLFKLKGCIYGYSDIDRTGDELLGRKIDSWSAMDVSCIRHGT